MQKMLRRHGFIALLLAFAVVAMLACNTQPDVIEVVVTATPDVAATIRVAVKATVEYIPSPSPTPPRIGPAPSSTPTRLVATSTPTKSPPTQTPTPTSMAAPTSEPTPLSEPDTQPTAEPPAEGRSTATSGPPVPTPGDLESLPWVLDGLTFEEGWTYRKLQNMDPSLLGALMDRDWLQDEISPVEDFFISNMYAMASMGTNLPRMVETVLRMPFTESIDSSDASLGNMLVSLLRRADDEKSQKMHLELFQMLVSEPNVPDGMIMDSDTLRIT